VATGEASGLLVRGKSVEVPGLTILGPRDAPWAFLEARDRRQRPQAAWVRQIIVHTTNGTWPHGEPIPGAGRGGRDKQIAEYWSTSPEGRAQSGGAHLVVDNDGSIVCLADLALVEAYHATVSNPWSIGIEMFQESGAQHGGRIYEAVLASTVQLVLALCRVFELPLQIPGRTYPNAPMGRMVAGGPDMVGVFGHRDNTHDRGRGDPGDEIFARLRKAGAEPLDFDAREDLRVWKRRQQKLNGMGERLVEDGIAGPRTIAAMRRRGFEHGRALDAA
jgi:hypothetical protein